MVSRASTKPKRMPPHERRAEIVAEAANIALSEGLERITLRAVAERLDVRPGLISHYFPAAEELVIEAFALAIGGERETLFPTGGTPTERVAVLIERSQSEESRPLAQLWLNARHLSRFHPALAEALADQEALDRDRLVMLVREGIRSGEFSTDDPLAAAIRIFVAVDGVGAYVNNVGTFSEESFTRFAADTADWALGLPPGTIAAATPGRSKPSRA